MLIKKLFLLTTLFLISFLASCSHQPMSTRDINESERVAILEYTQDSAREPANIFNKCAAAAKSFFKIKAGANGEAALKPLPELTLLNPQLKKFPNGRNYIEYTANIGAMYSYPDYEEFLERTVEVLFTPNEPFGHMKVRIGKKIYSFNVVKNTSIKDFVPEIKNSTNPELPGSVGYIFEVDKARMLETEKDIAAIYHTSAMLNIPPFDAFSPKLKIYEEVDAYGKKQLKFKSTSPKFANTNLIFGKITNENGKYYLDAGNGVRVDVEKVGDDYFTQSYSCSSSVELILEKFFDIKLSYAYSAKSLQQSLAKGNIGQNLSPMGVMKYHD